MEVCLKHLLLKEGLCELSYSMDSMDSMALLPRTIMGAMCLYCGLLGYTEGAAPKLLSTAPVQGCKGERRSLLWLNGLFDFHLLRV